MTICDFLQCEFPNASPVNAGFHESLVGSLAEWIVTFVTTDTTVKVLLLFVNIPIYLILGRLIFGDWKRFWRVVMFSLTPIFVLFRRKMFRNNSWVPLSWSEIGLAILLNFLWLALYFVQYIVIKAVFLS